MKGHILFISLLAIIFIPFVVKADNSSKTIQDGFVISESDYNKLRQFFSDEYISTMNASEYYNFMMMGIDFEHVGTSQKYFRTETNNLTGETVNYEITKQEYENAELPDIKGSIVYETAYKKLVVSSSVAGSNVVFTAVSLNWKTMPATRSYDIIGVRFDGLDMVMGSQTGDQIYKENGTTSSVSYSYNGTNSKYFDEGFGISMNLVNNTGINFLESIITVASTFTSLPVAVYGSYQHAVKDVTLATSKNYTLGNSVGGVFVFGSSSMIAKYDCMSGAHLYVTS